MKQVKIGCYSAFWGDSAWAINQFVDDDNVQIDYLVADYLAELTMGLLAKGGPKLAKASPVRVGYIAEFLETALKPNIDVIIDKGIKIIANAGGLDPTGLKHAIDAFLDERDLSSRVKVAAVTGDDLLPRFEHLRQHNAFSAFDALSRAGEEEALINGNQKFLSLNAYLGAEPITEALREGATIVITGRCVDSAVILGPLAFEYDWKYDKNPQDLDHLASASLAGHIIECGCQATGGNFTDWKLSAHSPHGGWSNMGYPILAFDADGTFAITKSERTGGIVSEQSVCEQMLYEVLDPENYVLPDVVLDMSKVQLEQAGQNTVRVSGARGKPPTPFLKCTAVAQDGFRASVDYVVRGDEAESKARALAQAVLDRTNTLARIKLEDKTAVIRKGDSEIILIGSNLAPDSESKSAGYNEIVVRIAVKHGNREVLDIFSKEAAAFLTNSCPGLFLLTSGRPKSSPGFVITSALVRRDMVRQEIITNDQHRPIVLSTAGCVAIHPAASRLRMRNRPQELPKTSNSARTSLHDIAVGRSGDKGDVANIAIIARRPEFYTHLLEQVTPEKVYDVFKHLIAHDGSVTRFEVPGVHAINFVLTKALGGGGLSSLRLDRQGKSYAQMALSTIKVDVTSAICSMPKL